MSMRRRQFLKTAAAGAATVPLLRTRARAQAKPIRIGYTMSATGPYAVGAGITQAPNYTLWQDQVNAQGGLAVKGEGRRTVEFVTIDDRSEIETAVRFYEKLATDDKVDLLLPPWGSAMNFAIAPVAGKYGYPMIGPTAISGKFKELALPYFYTMLVQPAPQMQAVAAMLKDLREQGKIKKVAVAYVNDLFGIELNAATGPAFKAAGLEVVDTKSYPLGAKDLSPVLKRLQGRGRRRVRRAHLPARQHPRHLPGQGGGLEPGRLLHRGGHRVPVLPRPLQGRGGRDGHRGLEPEGEVRRAPGSTSTRT